MKANKIAQQKLGLDPGATYMPHLSLLYSNMDQKERCDTITDASMLIGS